MFIAKYAYDLIDFKIHHIYYDKLRRELSPQIPRADFRAANLVECPTVNICAKSTGNHAPYAILALEEEITLI